VDAGASKLAEVRLEPMGIIHVILPFNYPFFLNFKGILPNLLLGNTMLVRNPDSCPRVGIECEKLFQQAGFEAGVYSNVMTSNAQLEAVLARREVVGVSFTGSSLAGESIAALAGKYLKRCVMELGGNDPFIVLEGANLEEAVKGAVAGRCANSGQVCFSPKRFIIHSSLYDAFKDKLI
jgi:succinate-semialdehyde dehydrogenase/glutarate-semialdehyde dehydrogenase